MKRKVILSQKNLFNLSQKIRDTVLSVLINNRRCIQLNLSETDLKANHFWEDKVYNSLKRFFVSSKIEASIHIEGYPSILSSNTRFHIFIDPVDGSLNCDLAVGDPAVVIAYAYGKMPSFKDIFCGYVYCLRSKDTYFSKKGCVYYRKAESKKPFRIKCDSSVKKLKDAILYYNDGYGQEFAEASFKKAGALPLFVKHRNAFDNAAAEICQLARGAAHLRVEARSYQKGRQKRGSDHANILTAFSIGKPAGLIVTDLEGKPLDDIIIKLDESQDFICVASKELLDETLNVLRHNQELLRRILDRECKSVEES